MFLIATPEGRGLRHTLLKDTHDAKSDGISCVKNEDRQLECSNPAYFHIYAHLAKHCLSDWLLHSMQSEVLRFISVSKANGQLQSTAIQWTFDQLSIQ